MLRLSLLGSALLLSACAGRGPAEISPLCGTWAGGGFEEQWWRAGPGLAGEGRATVDGVTTAQEQLKLRPTRGGFVYVATPRGAAQPTRFTPLDPADARFGPAHSQGPQTDPNHLRLSWADYAHDFPQEIHYRIDGDRLAVTVSGPSQEHGWILERVAGCADSRVPLARPGTP